MVAMSRQQHVFMVEAPSTYVTRVGLYDLVAASNPSVGEEARVEAVRNATAERRLGLDAVEEPVALSRRGACLLAARLLSIWCVNNLYPKQPQGGRR
jgi:hypothetical protein